MKIDRKFNMKKKLKIKSKKLATVKGDKSNLGGR